MNLIDYCITTGEKQGNSKHFQNFLAINGRVNKLESDNDLLKWMVNEKEKELIKRGLKLSKLSSEVSILKTKESELNTALNKLEEINNRLIQQLNDKF